MAMSLQILDPETGRGMARRAPNTTESFYEIFWITKSSFLSITVVRVGVLLFGEPHHF